MATNAVWVQDVHGLEDAVDACGSVVAIDTEFLRTSTFFPIAGLYQLSSNGNIWLIDPLSIDDFGAFVDLLEDASVVKIMHACTEDLELLRHHLGAVPQGLFDTQFAYAYLSDRFSISHADLVESYVGETLSSGQTRSNWLRRPLSEAQRHYAAEDVAYLEKLFDVLRGELEEQGRAAWFAQDMPERGTHKPADPETYYRGVGRAWNLEPSELARLQALCAWRERTAMQLDVPRKRVVWDEHLVTFAKHATLDTYDIEDVLPTNLARRFGEQIEQVHAQAPEEVEAVPRPLTQGEGKVIKRLREVGVEIAQQIGFAPELLARKRDLEELYRHYGEHRELDARYRGWREHVVGDRYLQVLEGG